MSVKQQEDDDAFLVALERRELDAVKRAVALKPSRAHAVKCNTIPTLHYLLSCRVDEANAVPPSLSSSCESALIIVPTIAVIECLLSFGAQLDAIDPQTGNSVLHVIAGGRSPDRDGNVVLAEDSVQVQEYILRHALRPSLHHRNFANVSFLERAVAVGHVSVVDALFATLLSEDHVGVLGEAALADSACDASLIGLPIGVCVGFNCDAIQTATAASFPFRRLLHIAAAHAQRDMVMYLLSLKVSGSVAAKLSSTAYVEDPAKLVPLFDVIPPQWDVVVTTSLWAKIGSPLHALCTHFTPAKDKAFLSTLEAILQHTEQHHTTKEELNEEGQRLSERYHDHVTKRTPEAVYRVLRWADENGRTPLHAAADGKHDDTKSLMRQLLNIDFSLLQICDRGGRTPLDSALRSKKMKNAEWLLETYGTSGLGGVSTVRASSGFRK